MISDEALMLDFQGGSRDAFEQLYTRYQCRLCAFFRRRLANTARAEDLTQETFLAVIRGAAGYQPLALFRTYLYAIAMNSLLAERRKQAQDGSPDDSVREAAVRPLHDESLWIRQALQRLEPLEREILMLREYEQLSYADIAELLHLPVNTVRSRLFRARMALKQLLQGNPDRKERAAAGVTTIRLNQNFKGEACDA